VVILERGGGGGRTGVVYQMVVELNLRAVLEDSLERELRRARGVCLGDSSRCARVVRRIELGIRILCVSTS
jgi:hypothetical protein